MLKCQGTAIEYSATRMRESPEIDGDVYVIIYRDLFRVRLSDIADFKDNKKRAPSETVLRATFESSYIDFRFLDNTYMAVQCEVKIVIVDMNTSQILLKVPSTKNDLTNLILAPSFDFRNCPLIVNN